MKEFVLFLSLFWGMMGCGPTAVSDVAISPTVTATGTAVPIETLTALTLTPTSSSTSISYATVTPIRLTPTATPPPTATAVFTQVIPDVNEPTTITSSSAASFPQMWSQIIYNGSIFWTVPSSWWPVTDAVAPAITEGNLLYAPSTIQLSPLLLSQTEPSFPEGYC
jgi:hypothetical protein